MTMTTHDDTQPATNPYASRRGKIARLPRPIREQLNQRLQDGERGETLLEWLNSLLEVQGVLKDQFQGHPVTHGNLCHWRKGGYRDWLAIQDSVNLVRSLEDQEGCGEKDLAAVLITRLSQWVALHYASSARTLVGAETHAERRWERLRQLCLDITRFRRSEIFTERLRLERERLALDQTNSAYLREKLFWDWTERPDIAKKLHPEGRGGITEETLREIEERARLL